MNVIIGADPHKATHTAVALDGNEAQFLRSLRTAVREVTPLFGVRVEKWRGDGLTLAGVDSEPLVGAAPAIDQRNCRIPVGSSRAAASLRVR